MEEKRDQLAKIVGEEAVLIEPDILDSYSKDHSFRTQRRPQMVVKASSADEVAKIIKWANETSTPLVPVSSGPPHFHGDTVPGLGGAVMVDLSGMKRIIHMDKKNRMVIIEAGITYPELQSELEKSDLRLSMPLLPRSNKSVVASLIEREPTLIPKYRWLLSDPLRCLEVVWGNGHKMMTGEAGVFHSLQGAWKRYMALLKPFGPAQVDYYRFVQAAQGTMGIVTWAALRCERLPKQQKLFLVRANELADLYDFTYKLLKFRYGDEISIFNRQYLECMIKACNSKYSGCELPPWVLVLGLCGRDLLPEEKVDFLEKDIREMAQAFDLSLESTVADISGGEILNIISNPSPEHYWKLQHKGGCEDIFFLTTLDKTSGFIDTMNHMARKSGYSDSDIGVYIQPVQQGVSCHCEFSLPFDTEDKQERARVQGMINEASDQLFKQGAFFSRPYNGWADLVYTRDTQTCNILRMVKDLFDPNNIMNPGKLCF